MGLRSPFSEFLVRIVVGVLASSSVPGMATEFPRAFPPPPLRMLAFMAEAMTQPVRSHRFNLEAGDESFDAVVTLGTKGVVNGRIVFTPVSGGGVQKLAIEGFSLSVRVGDHACEQRNFLNVESKVTQSGALEVIHYLSSGTDVPPIPLRATFSPERGALKMTWDMPGVVRDVKGLPRYDHLMAGPSDAVPVRIYAGFGNVIENPGAFSLKCRGVEVSTRHAGADYPNGLSLVFATSLGADTLEFAPETHTFGYAAHHDNTFYFIPSRHGAFRAARYWRDVNGFRKSPGFDDLAGRMCFDEWTCDYGITVSNLHDAVAYGLVHAVFIKHVWQRWGFDCRLPDVFPPAGDASTFAEIARICRESGIRFCPHDNFVDHYPDAEGFSLDRIAFNRDGTPMKSWLNTQTGIQSYRWRPTAFAPLLERHCRLMRASFAPDGLFLDVFAAMAPFDFYDNEGRYHTFVETKTAWGDAFDVARVFLEHPNAPMISEGGEDRLVGHVDGGQSDHQPAFRWVKAFTDAERVPWHDIVTHGRMVLFAGGLGHRYAQLDWDKPGDMVNHGWASDDYLSVTAIGGRNPMCYGPFNSGTVMTYWLQHDALLPLARAEFEDFTFVDGNIHHQRSVFSNGCGAEVNRSDTGDWFTGGYVLPPYGYRTWSPVATSGVVRIAGRRCGFSWTKDAVFLDARPRRNGRPAGPWVEEGAVGFKALRTNGALRVEVDSVHGTLVATTLPGITWPYAVEIDPVEFGFAGNVLRYQAMPDIRRRTFTFGSCGRGRD